MVNLHPTLTIPQKMKLCPLQAHLALPEGKSAPSMNQAHQQPNLVSAWNDVPGHRERSIGAPWTRWDYEKRDSNSLLELQKQHRSEHVLVLDLPMEWRTFERNAGIRWIPFVTDIRAEVRRSLIQVRFPQNIPARPIAKDANLRPHVPPDKPTRVFYCETEAEFAFHRDSKPQPT